MTTVRVLFPTAVVLIPGSVAVVPDDMAERLIVAGDVERAEAERADEPRGELETRCNS
jgi:hypothetical protein